MKRLLLPIAGWLLAATALHAQYSSGRLPKPIGGRDFYEAKVLARSTFVGGSRGFMHSDLDRLTAWGTGVSMQRAFCLNDYHDYFIIAGLNATYSASADKYFFELRDSHYDWYWERTSAKLMVATLKLPLSFGWQLQMKARPDVFLMPYVGANGSWHCWGEGRITMRNPFTQQSQNISLFHATPWHLETASAFNVGTHLGLSLRWRHLAAGVEYNIELLRAFKRLLPGEPFNVRTSNLELSVGYAFNAPKWSNKTQEKKGVIARIRDHRKMKKAVE